MKVILIPEIVLDAIFKNIEERAKVWKEVCANKPEVLVEHFKLELSRLKESIKEAQ